MSRPYPPEFRRQALALVASGRTVVDVAAGGKAQVTLSVNPARLTDHPGLYEGHVVVRDSDQTIHIPISLYVTPPTHMLTLTATALPGTASSGLSAFANVINADDPDLFSSFVFLGATQAASVQVPDGDYWVTGEVDDLSNPQLMRSAIVGEPDVLVGADTSVTLDAANAVPVAVSVVGRATETDGSDVFAERGVAGRTFGFGVYSFAPTTQTTLFAQPTDAVRTGTFRVSSGFRLIDPSSPARYAYDLFHNVGDRVPDSMTYTVTPAIRSQLAEIDARFYGVDGNTAPYTEQRYGLTDSGFHHAPRNIAVQAPPIPTRQGAGPGSHGFGANRDRPQDT